MRHLDGGRKLNADTQHRLAMRRNLARSLFLKGRVVTTPAKAKATRPFVEKLVTRARRAHALKETDRAAFVHQVRILRRDLPEPKILQVLVNGIAPLFANRPGGYTRIIHEARRQLGDRSPLAILEFVERPQAPESTETPAAEEKAPKGKGKPAKGAKAAQGAPGAAAGREGRKAKAGTA
jgi:large subunit ribosomal protein L17